MRDDDCHNANRSTGLQLHLAHPLTLYKPFISFINNPDLNQIPKEHPKYAL